MSTHNICFRREIRKQHFLDEKKRLICCNDTEYQIHHLSKISRENKMLSKRGMGCSTEPPEAPVNPPLTRYSGTVAITDIENRTATEELAWNDQQKNMPWEKIIFY